MKFRMFKQLRSIFIIVSLIIVMFESTLVYAESLSNKDVGWSNIAVGVVHSLGVKEDGTVWAWGDNSWGEIGNGDRGGHVASSAILSPVQVKGLSDVKSVAAGSSSSFALKNDGRNCCGK